MAQKKQIQYISIIALLALMILLMGMVFLPYISVLLWSAVLYILVSPLYTRILKRMDARKRFFEAKRHLLAGLFSIGTVFIMAAGVFFIGFKLIGQGRLFIDTIKSFVEANPRFFSDNAMGTMIADLVSKVSLGMVDISTLDLKTEALAFLASYSDSIVAFSRSMLVNLGSFVLTLAFICFALYFFYLDATYLARVFIRAIPIAPKNTRSLLSKFADVTKNLFQGFFLVAFYQAIAAFIIFSIFRIQGALLFSVMLLFSSFIPMVGCAMVWFPLGLSVLVTSGLSTGITFLVLCAVFISFLDNFLRPFFLKDRIKIHPLLIFFSIIGGLKVFGFNGIILGPLVIILFFTILDIALEEETQHDGASVTVVPVSPEEENTLPGE
jgi:predicted PurR-regulated permease PerM